MTIIVIKFSWNCCRSHSLGHRHVIMELPIFLILKNPSLKVFFKLKVVIVNLFY